MLAHKGLILLKTSKIMMGVIFLSIVTGCDMPQQPERTPVSLRVATFNVSMDASNYLPQDKWQSHGKDALKNALAKQHPQIRAIAEIIQHTRPDVLVLNEFDTLPVEQGINVFRQQYLAVSQNGESPIAYPYVFVAPVNTGRPSGFDLNRDGVASDVADDAWAYGNYPGQYGMVVLSQFPILKDQVRTFQHFKWADLPAALRPLMPGTHEPWYNDEVWAQMPLSSKSHWHLPLDVKGYRLNLLVSHPTPPVFDGEENRNGRRNFDEIRFWKHYIEHQNNDFIYDDEGKYGGLGEHQRFVIAGDLNASIESKDNVPGAIEQLLEHPQVQSEPIPTSVGGAQHTPDNPMAAEHTASWRKRADYVLPSEYGIRIIQAGVFWPSQGQPKAELVSSRGLSSDHRLVWVDLQLHDEKAK